MQKSIQTPRIIHFFFSYHLLPIIRPATQLIKNAAISAATIVEPTGVPASMDNKIPITAQITDNITEHKVTQKRSCTHAQTGQSSPVHL